MQNKLNYFIIERLDQNEESDCLSNIYDLSILNKIKETKVYKKNKIKNHFNSIIKSNDSKEINQDKKAQIIKVIKKTILSTNLTYKWKLIIIKQILIFFHFFVFISGIATNIKDVNGNNIFKQLRNSHINYNNSNNYTNYNNITYNISDTNFTNYFENNITYDHMSNNSINNNDTFLESKKIIINKKAILLSIIINQIAIIPIWFIFIYKYEAKWNRINNFIYKFSNYLLINESYENKEFFYYLMKDYSILITKKKYYLKYKNSSNDTNTNKYYLPISFDAKEYIPENNIFLYCINIINDFILEDFAAINYYQLISNEDYNDINVLIKYIENTLNNKIKKFIKKIMMPTIIALSISIYYNKESHEYMILSTILVFLIVFLGELIAKKNFRHYKKKVDKFIDNYNDVLIPKKRFIYRKNKLIMFLALKDNNYTKKQIVHAIEKIINS